MNVLVIGLAETGVAVARRMRAEGDDVVVLEDTPIATDRYRARVASAHEVGATVVEAPDPETARSLAAKAELVVPSPLVRVDHVAVTAASEAGIPVRSEIDLAADRAAVPIIAVTGTNGKTTVTSMTAALLVESGVRARAAGNIGRPLIEAVADDDLDVIVAEVSSFQLRFTDTFAPRVAILLAITPDHLDWHGSFDDYVAAKARVTERQGANDLLVFDADDARATHVARTTQARTIGVSVRSDALDSYRVVDDALVFPDATSLMPLSALRRALMHDRTNALAAAAAAFELGATPDGARAALASYATMPHRVALVGEANGVRWYDDSKATNPDAALRAVASFDSVVLLAGGRNKGLDLSVLASLPERLRGVVAFGEAAPEVVAAFAGRPKPPVVTVTSMREAVRAAARLARPGDAVLLSPACASFDAYDGYAARGDDFAAEVRAEIATEAASQ
jgi:UDP-N-acetylmuramoylalanine--D-glutamate ligase